MVLREDGERIGSDFIGDIEIQSDSIGTDDDGIDEFLFHKVRRHIIGNECAIDFVF